MTARSWSRRLEPSSSPASSPKACSSSQVTGRKRGKGPHGTHRERPGPSHSLKRHRGVREPRFDEGARRSARRRVFVAASADSVSGPVSRANSVYSLTAFHRAPRVTKAGVGPHGIWRAPDWRPLAELSRLTRLSSERRPEKRSALKNCQHAAPTVCRAGRAG